MLVKAQRSPATRCHLGSRQCADLHAAPLGLIALAARCRAMVRPSVRWNARGREPVPPRERADGPRAAENISAKIEPADYRVIALSAESATASLGFQTRTT